jgi:hypothetical protein
LAAHSSKAHPGFRGGDIGGVFLGINSASETDRFG